MVQRTGDGLIVTEKVGFVKGQFFLGCNSIWGRVGFGARPTLKGMGLQRLRLVNQAFPLTKAPFDGALLL